MEKDDIKKLVLQAAQGNKAAFGALYEETGRTVYFSCLKLLGDPQLAEDITQETYLTALQKLGTLAQPENFPAWVNRIGINLCKMHFRNNAAPEDNSEEIIEEIPDEGLIPEEYVSNDAKRKIIMDIIDTVLTEEQRRSVILYYFDMLTVPEIAEVMNCTTGTVTSRLSAARKKIKEAVLIYEENNNDRLHAVVPVFILSKLLNKEASNTVLPKLTVFTGSASPANAVPDSVTSTKTISGGKVMFSTVKAKVIAGVCAVAVVGGGITAAVLANRDRAADTDKPNAAVQTDAQGDVNEQEIEDKLKELDENTDNEDNVIDDTASGVNSDEEPEMAVYTVSDEIKNAGLSSGLVQLNGDIMQVGGYEKTSDFCAKYADEYDIMYSDGTYEEKKDEMLNYFVGKDGLLTGEWWDIYSLTLIPKNEPKGDQITVYVTNLTAPDGQVSLADSYVVWAEETPMSNDIYTPAWIPTGMPARLSSDVLSTKKLDEIYDNIDDYSAQSVQDMLASQGISKGENSISGNYLSYVYSQGDMSMDGTYCVNSDTDPDVFVAYVAGEKNAAGLTPLYRYHFTFDTNSKKLYESRMYLAGMF